LQKFKIGAKERKEQKETICFQYLCDLCVPSRLILQSALQFAIAAGNTDLEDEMSPLVKKALP
jgi:hypothetical protein